MTGIEGLETDRVVIQVTREEIRRYCEAIGEENRLFIHVESAQHAGFQDILLPVTYPILFWRYFNLPWLENESVIMQGEQRFVYNETLIANEAYICQIKLVKVRQKGDKQFLQHELYIQRQDKIAATSYTTLVRWGNK